MLFVLNDFKNASSIINSGPVHLFNTNSHLFIITAVILK